MRLSTEREEKNGLTQGEALILISELNRESSADIHLATSLQLSLCPVPFSHGFQLVLAMTLTVEVLPHTPKNLIHVYLGADTPRLGQLA